MKKLSLGLMIIMALFLVKPVLALDGSPDFGLSMTTYSTYATNGFGSIGLHSNAYDLEFGLATIADTADSNLLNFSVVAGLKNYLNNNLYFTYGLNFININGKNFGRNFQRMLTYGVYVGLQYNLINNLLLDFRYFPLQLYSVKQDTNIQYDGTWLGGNVALGITYLFQ